MAKSHTRTRRRHQDEDAQTTTVKASWLVMGLVLIVGLVGVGAAGWYFAQRGTPTASDTAVPQQQGQFTALQEPAAQDASSPQDGQHESSVAEPPAGAKFLGPETDADGLAEAEAGQLGQPALVWFHADWCHVCQTIKPSVAQIEKKWDGKVDLVRLNVDHPEARDAVRKYRVRGTPTFVFITRSGKIIDNMVGWPGQGRVEQALTEILAMN